MLLIVPAVHEFLISLMRKYWVFKPIILTVKTVSEIDRYTINGLDATSVMLLNTVLSYDCSKTNLQSLASKLE